MKKIIVPFIVCSVVLCFGDISHAKRYTKDELKVMVQKKKFPKTDGPDFSERDMAMAQCADFVSAQRVELAEQGYPTKIVKETSENVIIEMWGSNAKSRLECIYDMIRISVFDYI